MKAGLLGLTSMRERTELSGGSFVIEAAWRKSRYKAAFIAKLSDAENEACETQVWIEFAVRCRYLDAFRAEKLTDAYEQTMGQIVKMIEESDKWLIKSK